MKKKMQILVPALAVLTLAAGCRSQQNAENDNQVQVVVTSEPIFVPHREISPADSILGEYLIVRDNRWHLTITLDEAVALGADRKAFRKNIKLVEEQNKDIERCEKEGVEIIFYPPNIEWLRKKDRSFTIPRQSTVEDLKKLFVIDDDGNRIPVWPDETEEDTPPEENEQNKDYSVAGD